MSEISLYIDSHLVGKRAKRIFSRRMWMVFGFGLNHTSESSVRAKYTIYLPSFLAAIHYYVAFPLVDILFITKEPLLIPKVSRTHIWAEMFRYGYTPCYWCTALLCMFVCDMQLSVCSYLVQLLMLHVLIHFA
jgi:hypothetical protein